MDTYTFHRSPASLSGCSHRPTTPRGALFPLIVGLALAATATADSRLEYFGFSGGCESETFVQETAPFSNLCVIDIQDQRLLDHEWVAKMTVRDVKLMVATHDTFYERVPVAGQNRDTFELRSDFRQRWQEAIAGKEAALATLAAFIYIADEPNWTGISRSELEAAHDEIKRSNLRARTLTSFNLRVNTNWFEGRDVPTDAVAYHQYSVFDPSVDPDFQANVAVIKSYSPGKDFLYVMDSWWTAALHGEEGIAPLDMAEVARNYYLMASEDPDAVGLLGFHWPTFVLRQSESTMRQTAGCCGSLNLPADLTAGPSPCPAEGEWPTNKPEFLTSH